eukprot:scaffold1008_cov174-Amphora_coffeaeformis.AAC.3
MRNKAKERRSKVQQPGRSKDRIHNDLPTRRRRRRRRRCRGGGEGVAVPASLLVGQDMIICHQEKRTRRGVDWQRQTITSTTTNGYCCGTNRTCVLYGSMVGVLCRKQAMTQTLT